MVTSGDWTMTASPGGGLTLGQTLLDILGVVATLHGHVLMVDSVDRVELERFAGRAMIEEGQNPID